VATTQFDGLHTEDAMGCRVDQAGSTTRSSVHMMELTGTSGNVASGVFSWLTRQFWRRRRRAAQRPRSAGQSW
jgi:hypothetical protein